MSSPPTEDATPRWSLWLVLIMLPLTACGGGPSTSASSAADGAVATEDAGPTTSDSATQDTVSVGFMDAQTSADSEVTTASEEVTDTPSDAAQPGSDAEGSADALPEASGEQDAASGASYPLDDVLRLNHVQVKGTHNSYHQEPPLVFHESHGYSHPPLDAQMEEHGVRAFEIDVHLENGVVTVYHILFIDEETSCGTFTQCMEVIKAWSDVNVGHLPIMVWIEVKEDTGGGAFNDLTLLDDLIQGVFPSERLLTPDDVRGDHASLRDALEDEGWPTLGEVRDRAMFMVLNGGSGTDAYTQDGQTLEGRTMFMGAGPDQFDAPWAGVAKINDPGSSHVPEAHAKNILVASNGCGAGDEAADCAERLETALASGVQMYKDDFLQPTDDMSYWLDFPDGNPARCNAVTAPTMCTSAALESL